MALERSWFSATQSFTLDGNASGLITVADSAGFYVGQIVQLSSNTQSSTNYKIKRIEGKTKIYVGPAVRQDGQPFHTYANVSNFLVSDSAKIYAAEQGKPTIKPDEWEQNTHEHEPILAKRVINVDQYGNHYTQDNPMPVTMGLPTLVTLVPESYDDAKIIRNSDGLATQYQFFLNGVSVGNVDVTYDADSNSIRYRKA